jgi:GNAT superfamily N-acetyltransferase
VSRRIAPREGTLEVSIREYRPSDLEACRALQCELVLRHREIYGDPGIGGADPGAGFDEHLRNPDLGGVWVAVADGRVVGLTSLLVRGDEADVEPIIVARSARSRGVGGRLLARAIDEARRREIRFLGAKPVARNAEALAFFHEHGFATLGHLDVFLELSKPTPREWKDGITVHGRRYRY